MRLSRHLLIVVLGLSLSIVVLPMMLTTNASAQTTDLNIAIQRGYRTGYSDGYMAGYRDNIDSLSKSFTRHAEYTKADRAYNKDYGTMNEYRDGYQQGFESGYTTGFEKRSFESNLPTDLKMRGAITNNLAENTTNQNQTVIATTSNNSNVNTSPNTETVAAVTTQTTYQPVSDAVIIIPRETELMLEMQTDISTERSREGDKFTAKIVSPAEIAGATVEGRISKVTKPGRIKRRSELSLSFDRIILTDNRWSNFSAVLTEVMPVKGDNVKRVDSEGTAIGKSSFKDDGIKVGAATGTGLVIGAIAGGPVGAAVGAGVGAAFGVGAVVIQRGKHVSLNRNQQLRIKTSYESQIR